jgi:phage terminase small subunit
VADAIARAKAERSERTQITADQVVRELAAVGFSRMMRYARWGHGPNLELTPSDELDELEAAALLQVTETTKTASKGEGAETLVTRERSIKLHDKIRALTKLGEHLGMWDAKGGVTIDPQVPGGVQIFLPDREIRS